jgi:hypothetical protein
MPDVNIWIKTVWIIWLLGNQKTKALTEELGYSIEKFDESPGIYN